MTKPKSQSVRDNRANQLNPNNPAYDRSRGVSPSEASPEAGTSKPALDNRSNQLNPNNAAHDAPRGEGSATASDTSSNTSSAKSE